MSLNTPGSAPEDVDPDDDYGNLPEPIKLHLSREQWLWLSDFEKATLVERECEPPDPL